MKRYVIEEVEDKGTSDVCGKCFFDDQDSLIGCCMHKRCARLYRPDGRSVYFQLTKTEDLPET